MKSFVVFCIVFVVGVCATEKGNKIASECIKESGVKSDVLAEAKKGNLGDDPAFKEFTYCFFKKVGIVGEDGKLNRDVAIAKLPSGVDKAEAEKLLDSCKSKTGKDAVETVYEIFKCYQHGTKSHIMFAS
ncbi:B1 protein-like [Spodoptera litura]|uniref:B1 protein-like n=1 Tax=Spodoptera litura TaxID=69820 RepID=A0A0M4JRC2_SPOLT